MHDFTITTPAGATTVDPWTDHEGQPVRYFSGTTRVIGGVEIAVAGTQTLSGVDRTVYVNDQSVTCAEVDQIIAALSAVREELR
jgi:hypothetical protein